MVINMYKNYSVLFVDDEINILMSIRRGLLDEEYSYYFASSANEALKLMSNQRIDVVISDMLMPEINGLELLKIVSEKWPKTVKIVLSGYTQLPQILVTINQVDIFKFLTKPWVLEELIVIVHKALDYYIIQEENANYKKILETKNQTYQSILKKVDEVIADAKKSSEILGLCGKAILGFGKNFNIIQREKYKRIFNMQDEIFDIFSKAVTNEKKDFNTQELTQYLSEQIILKKKDAKIKKNNIKLYKLKINVKMLEATIDSILIVFNEEFKEYGMFLQIGAEKDNTFIILIESQNTNSINSIGGKGDSTMIDVKIDFLKSIVEEALAACQITFRSGKINGKLVIGIILSE
jgi:response regulator RpfG family c-di-GMP phosphodiesterase